MAIAALIASRAELNVVITPSPSVFTHFPPCRTVS
jgi:hypothetical protein